MSTGSALHRYPASGFKRKIRHLTTEDSNTSQRAAPPPEVINIDGPPTHDEAPTGPPGLALTNTSVLEMASARIEAFVQTLRYAQQRAVFQDNAMRYITTFAKILLQKQVPLEDEGQSDLLPAVLPDHHVAKYN